VGAVVAVISGGCAIDIRVAVVVAVVVVVGVAVDVDAGADGYPMVDVMVVLSCWMLLCYRVIVIVTDVAVGLRVTDVDIVWLLL